MKKNQLDLLISKLYPVHLLFDEEQIQEMAEDNIDRKLTKQELEDLLYSIGDSFIEVETEIVNAICKLENEETKK